MKNLFFVLFLSATTTSLFGQKASIDLTFKAQSGTQYLPLDSIRILNIDQGADTTLSGNDTVLTLTFTVAGIGENIPDHAKILVEYPNSINSLFLLKVFNPGHERGVLSIFDFTGRECAMTSLDKGRGWYSFRLAPGQESMYVVSFIVKTTKESIKLINTGGSSQTTCKLVEFSFAPLGIGHIKSQLLTGFQFSPGDSLYFTGYVNNQYVIIQDAPLTSGNYTFQFPLSGPCQGITSFTYGGQVYNTIEIGTQCIMQENLNIGTFVLSTNTGINHSDVSNNGIIEKYCYNNDTTQCAIYGGLYDWDEMMQYATTPGCQGICPAGWHIPTTAEWTTLAAFLGGASIAGGQLKESGFIHWNSPNTGATNTSGFTALGAGGRDNLGAFYNFKYRTYFWSSSLTGNSAWTRYPDFYYPDFFLSFYESPYGFSVRCFKN